MRRCRQKSTLFANRKHPIGADQCRTPFAAQGLVPRQSGYAEQPQKSPRPEWRRRIGLPHSGLLPCTSGLAIRSKELCPYLNTASDKRRKHPRHQSEMVVGSQNIA